MNDNAKVAAGVVLGGTICGLAAHLLLTAQGRQTVKQLRPALADLSQILQDVRATIDELGRATNEGRRVVRKMRAVHD